MSINFLKYDQIEYDLEERNLYGIYENDTLMWYIEIFPKGEENYLMLNSLSLNNLINPFNLQYLKKEFDDDLYEHTVQINGEDGFIQSLKLEFGEWGDNHYSKILIHGTGIIEHDLEEIE